MATPTVNGITLEYKIKTDECTGKQCVVIKGKNGKLEGALEIPAEIDGIQVAEIGNYAFEGCEGLTSVTIPAGVTNIGDSAFSGCSGLTSVTIPASVTSIGYDAFSDCSGLTSVMIPAVVTHIGDRAFYGCGALTNVTIPDSVTSIVDQVFQGCEGLTSVSIPDGVTSIGNHAFCGCSGLTSVTIPDSVTSIGEAAFFGCTGLTSVTIPDSVTSVGDGAFNDCKGLSDKDGFIILRKVLHGYCGKSGSAEIPTGVTSIGGGAFSDCGSLTSVTIPDSVTSIGEGAFSDCCCLTSVTIPDSVTSIGNNSFKGCKGLADNNGFVILKNAIHDYCGDEESVVTPEGVTSIVAYAFQGYSELTSVTILDGVRSIGECAFDGCGLTSVVIPDSVMSIGDSAFAWCKGLKSVSLPKHLEGKLPKDAFEGCSKKLKVTYRDKASTKVAPAESGGVAKKSTAKGGKKAAAPKSKGGKEETAPAKKTAGKKALSKKGAAKKPTLKKKKTYDVSFLIWGNYTDSNLCGTGTIEAESEEQAIAFFNEDWTTPGMLSDVCIDSVEEFEDADSGDDDEDRKCWNTSFSVTGKHGSYCGCGGPWTSTEDEARALQIKDLSEEDGLGDIEELSVNAPF